MKKNLLVLFLSTMVTCACLSQSFVRGDFTTYSVGDPELFDIDDDEKVDVIGLEKFGFGSVGDLVIYKNQSNIDSIAFEMIELGITGIGAPAVADLDGDDDLDIIVSEWNGSNAAILALYNDGNLQFTKDTIAVENLYRHSLADLDGDDDLDIVSTNRDDDAMQVFFNQGNGDFLAGESLERDDLFAVVLNDLDDDGDNDIIIGFDNFFDSSFIIWANNGSGDFSEQSIGSSDFGNLGGFKITDVDGNGLNDIVFFGRNSSSLRVILQTAVGTYEEQELVNAPNLITGLSIANFDTKNNDDILLGGSSSSGITFYLNEDTGPFDFADSELVSSISPAAHLEPSDLDGDGDLDVVVSNGDFWWLENVLEQGTINVIENALININIYPNPFDQEVYIDNMEYGQVVEIFDLFGHSLLRIDGPVQKVDLHGISPGAYLLKITDDNKSQYSTYRLIKR